MNIINIVRKISYTCIALSICLQPAVAQQSLDRVVAIVNNQAIAQSELDNYINVVTSDMLQGSNNPLPPKNVLQQQILNRMILDKIQLQLAAQVGIEVDSFTVSQTIQNIASQQRQSVDEFKHAIEKRGVSFNDYRELLRTDLTIQHLQNKEVSQEISISKAEIESYLSSPVGQDQSGAEYRLGHILILTPESPTPEALKKAQQQAEEIVSKLKSGADFNKLAMSKSAGQQALKGGDLGWRTAGEMPTLFVSYVPTMKVGDIAGPIKSASGFHIIRLQEKRVASEETKTETRVRQILIKADANTSNDEAKAMLTALHKQLNKGADFAKLATQKSQEMRTAAKGGDMGWVSNKLVLPKFYQVMVKLRNNEISEPFQTEEGWHLIQVLERRTQLTSNEAAWNKAREILTIRKTNEALDTWTKRIRDEAQVEIML